MNAALYIRQSLTREGSESMELQEAKQREIAERLNLTITHVFREAPSTSGMGIKARTRPQWLDLIKTIKTGTIDCVIAYKTDRLSRNGGPGYAPLLEAFEDAGKDLDRVVVTPSGGFVSEFEVGIRATMDREEGKKIQGRALDRHERLRGQLRWKGGARPYGYTAQGIELVPTEAAIITEMANRVLAGEGTSRITDDLNARSVPTAMGRRWSQATVKNILTSGRISGQYDTFRSGERVTLGVANWPAIISPEDTLRLRSIIENPARRQGPHPRSYPLSKGLLVCGKCAFTLTAHKTAGVRRYQCLMTKGGCNGVGVNAEGAENYVLHYVAKLADDPAFIKAFNDARSKGVDASIIDRIAMCEREREDLLADRDAGLITRKQWLPRATSLKEAIDRDHAVLAAQRHGVDNHAYDYLGRGSVLIHDWPSLSIDAQHATLRLFLDSIIVNPAAHRGGRFDPSRLLFRLATATQQPA